MPQAICNRPDCQNRGVVNANGLPHPVHSATHRPAPSEPSPRFAIESCGVQRIGTVAVYDKHQPGESKSLNVAYRLLL